MGPPSSVSCDWVQAMLPSFSCYKPVGCSIESGSGCCTNYVDECFTRCEGNLPEFDRHDMATNCLMYANISQYFEPSPMQSEDSNKVVLNLARSTQPRTPAVLPKRLKEYAECLPKFCNSSSADCDPEILNTACSLDALLPAPDSPSLDAFVNCKSAICPKRILDPDVAGIGVYISYILQFFITFLLGLTLLSLRASQNWYGRKIRKEEEYWPCRAAESMYLRQLRIKLERCNGVFELFVKAASNFNKAQCFFSFALAVATADMICRKQKELSYLDKQVLVIVAGCGIYLITALLVLLTFIDENSVSWFSFFIAFLSWLMDIAVSRSVDIVLQRSPEPACNSISLAVFCGRDLNVPSTNWYFVTVAVMALVLAARLSTLLKVLDDHLSTDRPHKLARKQRILWRIARKVKNAVRPWEQKVSLCRSTVSGKIQVRSSRFPLLGPGLAAFAVAVPTVSCCAIIIRWVSCAAGKEFWRMISKEWTIGQILAVTMWLPFLADFIESWHHWSSEREEKRKAEGGLSFDKAKCQCGRCSRTTSWETEFVALTPAPSYSSQVSSSSYPLINKDYSVKAAVDVKEVPPSISSLNSINEYYSSLPTRETLYSPDEPSRFV